MPLVSVVLPTHNRPALLAEALTSVLEGEFTDLEVVVSNNGEPEDTRRLQSKITDPRVRWVEQDGRFGIIENLIAGLAMAQGKYIAILHDDDRWTPGFLALLVRPLERHAEAVLAFADHYIMDANGMVDRASTAHTTRRYGRGDLGEGLYQPFFGMVAHQTLPLVSCVFRRDALPMSKLTPEVGNRSDIWIAYLLASTTGAAYYRPVRVMYYRLHGESDTSRSDLAGFLAAIHCRRQMLDDPRLAPYRGVLGNQLARDHVLAGARFLRNGQRSSARSHLAAAIRLDASFKALAGWAASWLAPKSLLARL